MKASELAEQASMTTAGYLNAATKALDTKFGEGFAEKNPELVGSLVRTMAIEYATAQIALAAERLYMNK